MNARMNPYDVLGVDKKATAATVRAAYGMEHGMSSFLSGYVAGIASILLPSLLVVAALMWRSGASRLREEEEIPDDWRRHGRG